MRRACFTLDIRAGTESRYDRLHTEMNSDLIQAIHESGMTNYTLFRTATKVIGYMEAEPNFAVAKALLASRPEFEQWGRGFVGVFARKRDRTALMTEVKEIWHVD